jgi:hypothetical protein
MSRGDWDASRPRSALRVLLRGCVLAIAAALVVAGGALAATHFTAGALYTGRACTTTGVTGTTCTFRFRASNNGSTLRFVGKTVVSTWRCQNGGGEALIGGIPAFADPMPVLTVRSNRTIHGSAGSGTHKVTATGTLGKGARTATVTFHGQGGLCSLAPVTLKRS